jgi:hypothetical protein
VLFVDPGKQGKKDNEEVAFGVGEAKGMLQLLLRRCVCDCVCVYARVPGEMRLHAAEYKDVHHSTHTQTHTQTHTHTLVIRIISHTLSLSPPPRQTTALERLRANGPTVELTVGPPSLSRPAGEKTHVTNVSPGGRVSEGAASCRGSDKETLGAPARCVVCVCVCVCVRVCVCV